MEMPKPTPHHEKLKVLAGTWTGDETMKPSPWDAWEGDTLLFEMASPMGRSRYIYKFQGDGRYEFSIRMSRDGKTFEDWLTSSWTRR